MYATICNIPIAIAAILRGMLPLHCSSLLFNDKKVMLFLGEKGIGKTTFACVTDNDMLGSIFGDDMITISSENGILYAHRGSRLMKVGKDTALLLDSHRISDEVYPGVNKNYYFPKNNSSYDVAEFNKAFILVRGHKFLRERIPDFLYKSFLTRHIIGIKVLESLLAHSINKIINDLNISEIYRLTVPDDLSTLELCIKDIINSISSLQAGD